MLTYEVRKAWPTRMWVGRFAPRSDVAAAVGGWAPGEADVNAGVGREMADAVEEVGNRLVGRTLAWSHDMETYDPGDYVALRYAAGAYVAVVFTRSDGVPDQAESGRLTLHDPRVGAGHVSLPGLPWARPVHVSPEVGRVVVFPGWLAHSIAPLHGDHRVSIWWALGASDPSLGALVTPDAFK